jgi:hypothetical protein
MNYTTTSENGSKYDYKVKNRQVGISVNGEYWGSPQGDRFIIALLNDIKRLKVEIEGLEEDAEFLSCLEACGVDNWDGYGDAKQMMAEGDE